MPELPEAETIVRGLRPRLTERRVSDVEILHADVLRGEEEAFVTGVRGRRIEEVGRRGKNVVLLLSGDRRLVINLGMTGRLLVADRTDTPESTHPAVRFLLDDACHLVFDDVRRFGALEWLDPPAWRERDRALGVEPLSGRFTAKGLRAMLERSRSPLRSWLLDQRRLAGVGNIYAVEALWGARLHPRLPARSVDEAGARRLHRALRSVLRRAIEAGGTTIRDYRSADGARGEFVVELEAYGRAGEPCRRCGTEIERLVFSNRSAFLCPRCQPAPTG